MKDELFSSILMSLTKTSVKIYVLCDYLFMALKLLTLAHRATNLNFLGSVTIPAIKCETGNKAGILNVCLRKCSNVE